MSTHEEMEEDAKWDAWHEGQAAAGNVCAVCDSVYDSNDECLCDVNAETDKAYDDGYEDGYDAGADGLNPARGVFNGFLLSTVLWAIIFIVYRVVSR